MKAFFKNWPPPQFPVLLIVNKIDTTTQEALEEEVGYWQTSLPNAEIIPISALEGANTDYLLSRLERIGSRKSAVL